MQLDGKALAKKTLPYLFYLESFVDKTTFNSHSFNKINDFTSSQFATIMFYLFHLKPKSYPNENGMDKAQFSW